MALDDFMAAAAIITGIFYNLKEYSKTVDAIIRNPSGAEDYENAFRKRKSESVSGFLEYYGGFAGRHAAYEEASMGADDV